MIIDRLIGLASPTAALDRAVQLIEQERFAAAFSLLARAAKAGIPDAEYRIARCYLEGTGVPPSRAEGARWLERAASHNCVEAQSLLAALHVRGLAAACGTSLGDEAYSNHLFESDASAEPDFRSALKWARQAAERGSPEAQALLGYILTHGPESLRDQDDADRWYERSAMAGCAQGHLGYALSLARRATNDKDHRQAANQMRRAAAAKLPTAIYLLGVLTEHGTGVPRDPSLAAEYYRDAAENGHGPAQIKWGVALIEGRHGEQDLVAGESWLRRAALAGNPRAAALLGDFYGHGGPFPPNYAEAASWYRRAAEAGDKSAARALGSLYLTGAGVARDDVEAVRWFRSAAEQVPDAQFLYARMLAEGRGTPSDLAGARAWFARAADAGLPDAQVALAEMMLNGRGGAASPAAAIELFDQAAAKGHSGAMFALGAIHAGGGAVPIDHARAQRWFQAAAELGHGHAQLMLGRYLANAAAAEYDADQARRWFEKARSQGISEAELELAELVASLGPQQQGPYASC
ncbi:MAG: sel1 repeat family protein [Rhizobiales bacterium]|nr:sel1 repeat family protein [Hyphomicrobiales bacterium]